MRLAICAVLMTMVLGCSSSSKPAPQAGAPAGRATGPALDGAASALPVQAGPWTRPATLRRVAPEGIFDYMDGGGELYVGYRFDHLDVVEYRAADTGLGTILVELYYMKTPADAFGLLSTDWTGEPVELHPVEAAVPVATVPPHHGLYGAGLLRMWTGSLYIRVLASRETPAARDAVLAIGKAVAAHDTHAAPRFLASVPQTAAGSSASGANAGAPVRPDHTCFFRSHLVLNSQYFLSSQDILGLSTAVDGITAEYAPPSPGGRPIRLIAVRYPTPEAARAAAESFRKGYVPNAARDASGGGSAKTEHGWVVWAVRGQGLAVALDAADRESVRMLVTQATGLVSSEARPE